MRCTSPRDVGYRPDGKTISWSPRTHSKEYATFKLPCGKCIECRLEYAAQWALRCVHESKMHERNCFITLTYSDENLPSPRLNYEDWQEFIREIRRLTPLNLSVFVTGEYGEKTKRPHWHALIFGWSPKDAVYKYSNDRGDKIYESKTLTEIWGKGIAEFGSVTLQSANYCARYAAKKLTHGKDQDHDFHPISKKSQKNAIGKRWLEKHWPDIFTYGTLFLSDGTTVPIPRYYEKWLKEKQPQAWQQYVTQTKIEKMKTAALRAAAEAAAHQRMVDARRWYQPNPFTQLEIRRIILKQKFEFLQNNLKL